MSEPKQLTGEEVDALPADQQGFFIKDQSTGKYADIRELPDSTFDE